MARYVVDIETNGFLESLDTIHSLVILDRDSGQMYSCSDHDYHHETDTVTSALTIKQGVELLLDATQIVWHNGIKFDYPAIRKIYPWFEVDDSVHFDTLVCSRLIWSDLFDKDARNRNLPGKLKGSHSLEAWGLRMGAMKGDYSDIVKEHSKVYAKSGDPVDVPWEFVDLCDVDNDGQPCLNPWKAWNRPMQEYCEQDVRVTAELLKRIEAKNYSQQAIDLEHRFALIIAMQERNGFTFDEERAGALYAELAGKREELRQQLCNLFGSWAVRLPDFVPKRDNKKLGYKAGVPVAKYKEVHFNPASRQNIERCLKVHHNWVPREFTPSGQAKIDETILKELPWPEAQQLAEYFLLEKRIGQIAEGKQAWLKCVKQGRIHGSVNTNGAVTGRCTHSGPNVAQTPSVKVHKERGILYGLEGGYGFECRSCWIPRKGMKLVGGDASGLELRCLAHFMARYDGGEYVKVLLEGDIHTVNQEAAGLPLRDMAKTFIYAFLYGAGPEKIGSIVGKGRQEGLRLQGRFLAKIPALKKLKEAVSQKVKTQGHLIGLDGRRLNIRSGHAALNTLLQSAGALIMKQATVFLYDDLLQAGLEFGVDWALVGHIHDEVQIECKPELADQIGETIVNAIRRAGEHFNFRCPLDGEYKVGDSWAETH